jgi:hypothetical protein
MNDAVLNNATLSGSLDGVTGTFKRLEGYRFPDKSGETAIDLYERGIMNLYASDYLMLKSNIIDVRHHTPQYIDPQGNIHYLNAQLNLNDTYVTGEARFDLNDVNIGHLGVKRRATMLVHNYIYSCIEGGYYSESSLNDWARASQRSFQQSICYVIKCQDVKIGSMMYMFNADTIVFNNTTSYNYELQLAYTQRVLAINGGNVRIAIVAGNEAKFLEPKEAMWVIRLPNTESFLTPTHASNAVGAGILTFKL